MKINMKNIMPPTAFRVFLRTNPMINAEIRSKILRSLNILKKNNEPQISERIKKLNMEWDTERVLETDAAVMIILSSYLGRKTSGKWNYVTLIIGCCVLLHALQGWCPSLPIIRKWGVRTEDEINLEKMALKIMRGDFTGEMEDVSDLLDRVEKQ